jgi:4-hydroxy-3-methylbut-2-en-1-yl diphosphate reductase
MPRKSGSSPARIQKASELGLCFGVRRAVKMLKNASGEHKKISTLGPIVHNRQLVSELDELGVKVVDDISKVKTDTVAVSSHGLSPQVLDRIKARGLVVFDTTCPNVRSAQNAARELADAGFHVVIFGDAAHPEVKGLLGWAGENAVATLDAAQLKFAANGRVGVLSQTTQSQQQFQRFINDLVNHSVNSIAELRIINTLCRETKKRQDSALEMARESDLVIVVGGFNSANTRHLAEICSPVAETRLIESAAEIKPGWVKGKKRIGVTAGASTPDEAIDEVIKRLEELTGRV